ncbi:hypothetical protein OGAPHI_001170 [Ogataea philodendri]|uniref:Septin-type G domain-containing protein n=1 Tax=Ogataea philodendri TaxID=1378263 RepID=A0A9P8T9U1_9ASCO|nr:uncharacterized protein OGAPHI_001170 [Ogataea philodendri]KAH3670655.1 hypothetical protein OGAPHI_001170 [Ogataea philodendri]
MSASARLNIKKFLKRGLQLSILVVGQTGTGKSTFVNTLCNEDIITTNRPAPADMSIESHSAKIYEGGTRIDLDVIMAPGFGDFIDNRDSTRCLTDYIESQFEKVLNDECKIQRTPKATDTRIHAAIYFIRPTGKGLRELDVYCMRELGKRCNVIPVISKADLLTDEELALNRGLILRDLARNKINTYDFSNCFSDIDDDEESTSVQDLIPFAIVSGTDRAIIDQVEYKVRKLPHGVVRVDDPLHSDYIVLRTCLLGACLQDLKDTTHGMFYEKYRTEKLSKNPPATGYLKPSSRASKPTSSGSLLDRLRNNMGSRQSSVLSADRLTISEDARAVCGVEVFQYNKSFSDDVIVTKVHSGNGGQEHGVRTQIRGEHVARGQQVPWTDGVANNGTDESSASDVDVFCCDHMAEFGLCDILEKSGALTMSVAKLASEFIILLTKAQPKAEPDNELPWWMTGPPPSALTSVQIRNAMPAIGHAMALMVNKWRTVCGLMDSCFEVVAKDGPKHQSHTLASQHGLHAEPNTGHDDSVNNRPQRAPDSPGRPGSNGERNMVVCTVPGSKSDETAAERVAEPDGDPGGPPT